MRLLLSLFALMICFNVSAQDNTNQNKFRQFNGDWATPNVYRTGGGAPGHQYWQQQADYDMKIRLDDEKQTITGEETITYHNNSPDALEYLWIQLDQNMRAKNSNTHKVQTSSIGEKMNVAYIKRQKDVTEFDGGFKIQSVKDGNGQDISYTIHQTMMRINLPTALKSGEKTELAIKWWYNINDRMEIGGRSGYEYFKDEDNYLYTIAQFFPRMAVYDDINGWQNKQFLGRGEFALPFGDYKVSLTVPSDHVVASTGVLQNEDEILTATQKDRLAKAKSSNEPVIIITQEEAEKNEKTKASGEKTWVYHAENVRDFGFASSRKFIWDAQGVKCGDKTVMAMSYYPKEGNPLWEQYSTRAVAHTLDIYSKYSFDYPYPVAISVHAKAIGMEYPMICFNFGRPEKDGTYSPRTKYGMIGVIIHEVGHNYFPMIVNSDERQWTWMDEGLNSFVQFLTEQEWERNHPSRRGHAHKITDYMKGDKSNITPIMTNSESIFQFGNNAYGKPATALNILRETVMGRELFDYAFKKYCERWMFKHPSPEDFFRTMEDASAMDLDWFWRGWFYTTDHVDIDLENVKWLQIDSQNPKVEKKIDRKNDVTDIAITNVRNKAELAKTKTEEDARYKDFYNSYDQYKVTGADTKAYDKYMESLSDEEKAIVEAGMNYYQLDFKNVGGLVMPLIIEFNFTDGSKERQHIPAEIWKTNSEEVSKVFAFKKEVKQIVLDPNLETADTETSNNYWPRQMMPTRFEAYKRKSNKRPNTMQKAAKEKSGK